MFQRIHFISGLPSGSMLPAALLRQKPRIHAGVPSQHAGRYMIRAAVARKQLLPPDLFQRFTEAFSRHPDRLPEGLRIT